VKLSPLKRGPISREDLRAYAAASSDHNPIHLDETFAKEAGFPSVIVHGMLSMAFLADFILQNFPEAKFTLNKFQTRFRKVTFPGDVLTCEGEIKNQGPEGIRVSVWILNQNGEKTSDGEATLTPR
jgi:acyl dehydratase